MSQIIAKSYKSSVEKEILTPDSLASIIMISLSSISAYIYSELEAEGDLGLRSQLTSSQ